MSSPQDILQFWFDNLSDDQKIDKKSPVVKKWFTASPRIDEEIRARFENDYFAARRGELREWEKSPQDRLALIILFDQFSRNIYRNTPKAFESDALALDLTLNSLKEEFDQKLSLVQRIFMYMPLMHAEDLKMQALSVQEFTNLVEDSKIRSPQNTFYFEYNLDYARRHYEIISRFGRFPHRNKILGRVSTLEEAQFLSVPSSAF